MSTEARASQLRKRAHTFCRALISAQAPADLLAEHFTTTPQITEHGPAWARSALPFLGKTFEGHDECLKYFEQLAQTLSMQLSAESFPGPEAFAVDAAGATVTVRGSGRFASVETGKSWAEEFVYCLGGWDEEGRLGHWEIWADPLSAWIAVRGDPDHLMGS